MNSKKWLKIWILCVLFFVFIVGLFNYVVDPYGLKSNSDKYVHYLRGGGPRLVNVKLKMNADYYLIGTSRVDRIDPTIIENYINGHVYKINMDSSNLKDNILFASEVKKQNKNFIFGFDASTLNKNRSLHKEISNRYNAYYDEIKNNEIYSFYFNSSHLFTSVRDLAKRFMNVDLQMVFKKENKENIITSFEKIKDYLGVSGQLSSFNNYEIYSDDEIIRLAKMANKNDIFVIYPKFYLTYMGFHKYQDIEKKYFHALKVLVKNTKAKVWSFYQVNEITKNTYNFDYYGIHFKPKISKTIFAKIFSDKKLEIPKNFGILLSKDNVDFQIDELKMQLLKTYKSDILDK